MKKMKIKSIEKKLLLLRTLVIVPVSVGIFALLFLMINFNNEYNETIKNVTMASKFNFSFSEDLDYKMYRIVIGAEDFKHMKPYKEINQAQVLMEKLNKNAVTSESKARTRQIMRLLDNLEKCIVEIEKSDIIKDFSKNEVRLRQNVNIYTELIKDKMSEYIYYESGNLEHLRVKMKREITQTIWLSAISAGILVIIVTQLTKIISQNITNPIKELCDMTKEVASGNFFVEGPQDTSEEIQILTTNFENMVGRISELIEDVRREQKNIRKKELQLLQEQINPHFLYNTLDTIVWMAIDGQDEKIVEIVTALSGFFRTSLSQGEDMIPIRDELEHVRSYLQIQEVRYGHIMEYDIQVPEEIRKHYIIKMTLQPLVENALYHGLKMQRKKGKILINAVEDEDNIYLTVEDNGIGMEQEVAEKLNEEMLKDIWDNRTSGFGIANVNRRIKLYFGEEYGLILESEYQIGTKVIVVVPKKKQVIEK